MHRHQPLVIVAAAGFLFAAACKNNQTTSSPAAKANSPAAQSTPDAFAAVRGTFEKSCASCHGSNGMGGPVKLEDGTRLKVPTLCEGHALRHPDSEFTRQIEKGGDGMPAFKDKLKPEEIADLIRFIRHEFENGMTPPAEHMMSPTKNMNMK